MKLAIITDQHFGARKGADYIHKYFKKFYLLKSSCKKYSNTKFDKI